MALRHWMQLAMTDGIGPILIGRMIDAAGSAEQACAADRTFFQNIAGIGPQKSETIFRSLRESEKFVDDEIAKCAEANIALLSRDDDDYPLMLKGIPDPPAVLYVRGKFEPRDLYSFAIVGSRKCSHYGREQADRFAALLAGAGLTVVSGGARSVDSSAHRGAMQITNGRTIAVLGCGVDVPYPPENRGLFEQIAQRGAVVSEHPLGTPPARENFPRRNRIVSGLSRGVLVVEADIVSGALITARQAADEHGRVVFALPGRVDSPTSAGAHALIRDGAILATSLPDILEALGPLPDVVMQPSPEKSPEAPAAPATDRQHQILTALSTDPATVDQLIARTHFPAEIIMQELTMMTLHGLVRRADGQTYQRRR